MRKFTPEHIAKLRAAKLGRKYSEEHRRAISKGMKEYYKNETEEHREHRRKACKAYQMHKSAIYRQSIQNIKPLMDGTENK